MLITVAGGDKTFPVASPLAQPARTPFADTIAGAGLIEPSTQNIAVAPPVAGIITKIHVHAGQQVTAGTPLFTINEAAVAAEIGVRDANVQVAAARVTEADAQLAEANDQLSKVRKLSDPRAVSKEEVMRRQTAVRSATSRLKLAQASLTQARAQSKQSQIELARLTVRAPIDGEILQLNSRLGEFVAPERDVAPVVLGDTRTLHVRVDIDEADAARFKPGARAIAYPRGNSALAIETVFVRVDPVVIPKKSLTGGSGERIDTRVLQVLFSFERGSRPIFVGQQMEVFIDATAKPGAVREPKS